MNEIIFSKLHPFCVNLMKNKNKSKFELVEYYEKLNEILTINQIDSNSSDFKLAEYLLLPVFDTLNTSNLISTNQEILFNILAIVFDKFSITKYDLFLQILNKSTFLISNQLNQQQNHLYDEYFDSYMNLLRILLKKNSKQFYEFNNLTTIGLLISILLDILTRTDTLNIRLNVIKTLKHVCNLENDNKNDYKLGTILTAFLPGISIKLIQNFLFKLNLSVVNHKLVCSTVELLMRIVGIVLNDHHIEEKSKFENINQTSLNDNVKKLIINRSTNIDWVRNTRKNLKVLIEQLIGRLIKHDNHFIRLKMNEFCDYLLCETSFNILTCQKYSEDGNREDLYFLNGFLNLFLINSMDDLNEMVKNEGEKSIERLKNRIEKSDETKNLNTICSNNLTTLIYSSSVDILSHKLKLIYSYLNLMNQYSTLDEFYSSNQSTIVRLLQILISNVKFNYKNLNNLYVSKSIQTTNNDDDEVEESPFINSDIMKLTNLKGLKTFLNNDDDEVLKQIEKICQLFGKNMAIFRTIIFDIIFIDKSKNLNEIIYLVISMLNGMSTIIDDNNEDNRYRIIKYLISNIINTNNDYQSNSSNKPLIEQNIDIINACLNLQLLSCSSKCIKIDKFKQMFLLEVLSYILKNYQNENLLIKSFSFCCLVELCDSLGYKDVRNLLSSNYDYIINELYVYIENSEQSYLMVLCSLINICDVDIVVYLQQIIEKLFDKLQGRLYGSTGLSYLKIFCYTLVYLSKSIQKWFNIEKINNIYLVNDKTQSIMKSYKKIIDDINEEISRRKNEFINFHKSKLEEETNEDVDVEEKEEEPKEKILPNEIKIQIKCLEICQHLISYPNRQICLLVIQMIKNFSLNLVNLNYKDDLLPLLHKLWNPMIKQFCIDTSVLDNRIGNGGIVYQINICLIKLLLNLIELSDTFLIKRFNEEFLPIILDFMNKQSRISFNYKQRNDTTYIYSNSYKLQITILKFIPKIYLKEKLIDETRLELLIKSLIVPYLDKRQPIQLQNLSVEALKSFSLLNSDIIWLYIHLMVDFTELESSYYSKIKIKLKYENLMIDSQIKTELFNIYQNI